MNHPKAGSEKGGRIHNRRATSVLLIKTPFSAWRIDNLDQLPQQSIQETTTGYVQKDIGKMESVSVFAPDQIIKDIRDSLDRPIMAPQRVGKQTVAKCLKNQKRTANERV